MGVLAFDDVWLREPRLMVPGQAPLGNVVLRSPYIWRHYLKLGPSSLYTNLGGASDVTISGSPTPSLDGVSFNGSSDYLSLPVNYPSGAFTMLAVWRVRTLGAVQCIACFADSSTVSGSPSAIYLIQNSTNVLSAVTRGQGSGSDPVTSVSTTGTVSVGQTCVIAYSKNGNAINVGMNGEAFSVSHNASYPVQGIDKHLIGVFNNEGPYIWYANCIITRYGLIDGVALGLSSLVELSRDPYMFEVPA